MSTPPFAFLDVCCEQNVRNNVQKITVKLLFTANVPGGVLRSKIPS